MAGIIGKSAPVARPTRREPTKLAQAHPHMQGAYCYARGEAWDISGSSSHAGSIRFLARDDARKQPEKMFSFPVLR